MKMTTRRAEGGTPALGGPWNVLGVPSSAAAHWPGIEKAPGSLREAGLLRALGHGAEAARDCGDQAVARWAADREGQRPNNVHAVAEVLVESRLRVIEVLGRGCRPFVVGGECTLAIGMVSAFSALGRDVGVVYVDGGQDLTIPADHPEEPILDSMGVAHMLDLPGVDDAIAGIGPRRPLLHEADIVFFGYSGGEEDHRGLVGSQRIPASAVSVDPAGAAKRALAALSNDEVIIHIDVDVLNFLEVPAADVPVYFPGLGLGELTAALRVLVRDPRCAGVLLVEYNPDHDPRGRAAVKIVEMIRTVFA